MSKINIASWTVLFWSWSMLWAGIVNAAVFELAEQGCPMAHCDQRMSDNVRMTPPEGDVQVIWHRIGPGGELTGSSGGIGCSGNGTVVACTFRGSKDNLVVYDYDGNRLWKSGDLLNQRSWCCAPMVDTEGGVIASDQYSVIRFDKDGNVLWSAAIPPGGTPISPVITENGTIVLATNGGPISAYDSDTGELLAELFVTQGPDDPGFFETINTPGGNGNRLYVSMRYQVGGTADSSNLAWLVAIDVDPDAADPADRLKKVWHFEFGADSGASPLVIGDTVYFDGDRTRPGMIRLDPHMFAIRDDGDHGTELWRKRLWKSIVVSAAQDPRGGLWVFPSNKNLILPFDQWLQEHRPLSDETGWLVRLDQDDGSILEAIYIDDLMQEDPSLHYVPTSGMIMSGPDDDPIMLLNVTAFGPTPSPRGFGSVSTFIIGIELNTSSILWKAQLPDWATTFGAQFPILQHGENGPRIVFSTEKGGVWAIGVSSDP